MLMKGGDVEFAGYSIPHPAEQYMNVRVQAREGCTATDAMDTALSNLEKVCDRVLTKYDKAREKFDADAK